MRRVLSLALVIVLVLSSFTFTFAEKSTSVKVFFSENTDNFEKVYAIMEDGGILDNFSVMSDGKYKSTDLGVYISDQIEQIVVVLNDGSELKYTSTEWEIGVEGKGGSVKYLIGEFYTVTYDGNEADSGTAPEDTNSYVSDEEVTVLDNIDLVKAGSTFAGWNTADDGSGTTYVAGDKFSITGDTTLFAVWEEQQKPTTYTVTYDGNGADSGTVPVDGNAYEEDEEVTVLDNNNLAKEGSKFAGWNTADDSNEIEYVAGDKFSITGDTTLFAVWEEQQKPTTYTVTYDGNGADSGTVPVDGNAYEEDEEVTVLDNNNLAKEGSKFAGWNTADDSNEIEYVAGDKFSITGDTTLFAVWEEQQKPTTYTVTYDGNGADSGTVPVDGNAYEEDEEVTVLDNNNLAKEGSKFAGWNTADDSNEIEYVAGDKFSITGDTTLFAVWEEQQKPTTYTVTYDGNGADSGTVPVDGNAYEEDEEVTVLDNNNLAKEGSKFAGWNTADDSNEIEYAAGDKFSITGDTTLFAVWEEDEPNEEPTYYEVTYSHIGNGSLIGDAGEGTFESGLDLREGSRLEFTATPDEGNEVSHWIVNEEIIESTELSYIVESLDKTLDVQVVFVEEPVEPEEPEEPTRTTSTRRTEVNAVLDEFIINQNEVLETTTSELMDNDRYVDSFVSVQDPTNGTVSLDGTSVTFTPDPDFIGLATFRYTIRGDGGTDSTSVRVQVLEGIPLGAGLSYIMGYPDDTFRPEREVTRGEMAAIFARINDNGIGFDNPGNPFYEDVSEDAWYFKYVQFVTKLGLFQGYDGDMFKANRPVTKAEVAQAFSKHFDLLGIEIETSGNPYTDIEGHWAEEMITVLYNAGISSENIDEAFNPDRFATRTEVVVMVNRLLNQYNLPPSEEESPEFSDVSEDYWGYREVQTASGYTE